MIEINHELLDELGLGALPDAEKSLMLGQLYETLELRVGTTLSKRFSNEQLDEFERIVDSGDEDGALTWLAAAAPDYKDIVAAEWEALKSEVKASAADILAAT